MTITGTNVLDCLRSAAEKDVGEDQAKEYITKLLVLSCKGKILNDENMITRDVIEKVGGPINDVAIQVNTLSVD